MEKLYTFKSRVKFGMHTPSDRYFLHEDSVQKAMLAQVEKELKSYSEYFGGADHVLTWDNSDYRNLEQKIYQNPTGASYNRLLLKTFVYTIFEVVPEDA